MALARVTGGLCKQFLNLTLNHNQAPSNVRTYMNRVKFRPPGSIVRRQRVFHEDFITPENKNFINEVVQERMQQHAALAESKKIKLVSTDGTPLVRNSTNDACWNSKMRRTGLIAKKIGVYPLWSKEGYRIQTTLLQIVDNQVIKYIPPEEWNPLYTKLKDTRRRQLNFGCLLIGAETIDPTQITKQYYSLFKDTGVLPKKRIFRFPISPEAALPSGTPLYASHFRVGDVVDLRGLTIDRGFQGVMRRWGFRGMPASHGVTKTHRRPGNIGGGGEKARVWPGTKLPGHMGNRWRMHRGAEVLRINYQHNVLWVKGDAIPGITNSYVYMFDTVLPLHKVSNPPFPTHFPKGNKRGEKFGANIHHFSDPSITFTET